MSRGGWTSCALALAGALAVGSVALPEARAQVPAPADKNTGRARVTVSVPGVDVAVDGQGVGRSPLAQPLVLAPGTHRFLVSGEGYETTEVVAEIVAGEEREVHIAPAKYVEGELYWPEVGVALTAALFAGLGAGYFVAGSNNASDADDLVDGLRAQSAIGAPCLLLAYETACDDLHPLNQKSDKNQDLAVGVFVTSGIFTVATFVALGIRLAKETPNAEIVTVAPVLGPGMAGLDVGGSF